MRGKIAFSQQRCAPLILTLRRIRLLDRRQDKRRGHGLAQDEQQDDTMLEEAIHSQSTPFLSTPAIVRQTIDGSDREINDARTLSETVYRDLEMGNGLCPMLHSIEGRS